MGCNSFYLQLFEGGEEQNEKTGEQIENLLEGSHSHEKKMFINEGQEDQMEIFFYKTSRAKTAVTYLGFFLTCGILRLIYYWRPCWYLYSTSVLCKRNEAEKILIEDIYDGKFKQFYIKSLKTITPEFIKNMKEEDRFLNNKEITYLRALSVHVEKGIFLNVDRLLLFRVKKVTYIFNKDQNKFVKLAGLDQGVSCEFFHDCNPLSSYENAARRSIYGRNELTVRVSPILKLLCFEVLTPLNIFQFLSFLLWFFDDYYIYATAIILMSVYGIVLSVQQTRHNERKLKKMIDSGHKELCTVQRLSGTTVISENVSMDTLVPGDIIEIPVDGCTMQCDAVLVEGDCILDESVLTGESVPVTKTALPKEAELIYDPKSHARHTLFSGTKVIQTRYQGTVSAIVIRTGFSTAKGSLVRSILYPPQQDFTFERDSYKFLITLSFVAFIGCLYTIIDKIMKGTSVHKIIFQALDLITIVVPPALPAAKTIESYNAQSRLKRKNIYCISPKSIIVSGGINCVCFDKTGTLTEEGLDIYRVIPVTESSFGEPCNVNASLPATFFNGLVSCHSLITLVKEGEKHILGDPMDLKMFESTEWRLEDSDGFDKIYPTVLKPPRQTLSEDTGDGESLQIGTVRQFPFSSTSQRMGVIIRVLSRRHFEYYCKGSPEKILEFVKKETVPPDYHNILKKYADEGYRIIGLAHKELEFNYKKVQKVKLEEIEHNLNFLGLLIFENKLKPETKSCIEDLNKANIRTIMVTGDNILTAISVGRKCEMIQHGQRIITINNDTSDPPAVYYTVTDDLSNDFVIPSNSVSVVSLDTLESQIQSTSVNMIKENGNCIVETPNLFKNYRFAVTGKTWDVLKEYHPELLPRICTRGTIFARMSPEQKQQLVHELQTLGYCVAMCGDGANDCGALKAAHTGISLSDNESSIASPFTSRTPNIHCVLDVIREGRASLVTNTGIFKYMAGYSLCQFISVLILYSIKSNLTDMEFLYIDLVIITIFAYFFGKTEAYPDKLSKQTPLGSLLSVPPLLSLSLQMLFVLLFQLLAFSHLKMQSWYQPFHGTNEDEIACVENYTLFTLTSFQYIILAIAFSKGHPYRKRIYTNYGFIISAVTLTLSSIYLTQYPADFLQYYFELILPEDWIFRLYLLGYAAINLVLSIFVEDFFIDKFIFRKLHSKHHNVDKSKKKYLVIERDLQLDEKWPKVTLDTDNAASPLDPTLKCDVKIVTEIKNKFDNNHVLNKLFDNCNGLSSSSNSAFTTPNHHYKTPDHQAQGSFGNHETGYFSEENLDFSSLPSPSKSDTYKSFNHSTYDMASSQSNISDIPLDDL